MQEEVKEVLASFYKTGTDGSYHAAVTTEGNYVVAFGIYEGCPIIGAPYHVSFCESAEEAISLAEEKARD